MEMTLWIGIVGAICSTTASLPQVWKSYKYQATKDLHLFTLCIRIVGCGAWCSYGILLNEYPLAISSAIAFTTECLLLVAKCKYH